MTRFCDNIHQVRKDIYLPGTKHIFDASEH